MMEGRSPSKAMQRIRGNSETLIRSSVGIEDADDLINDLTRALVAVERAAA